jgi:hypothetical protein
MCLFVKFHSDDLITKDEMVMACSTHTKKDIITEFELDDQKGKYYQEISRWKDNIKIFRLEVSCKKM